MKVRPTVGSVLFFAIVCGIVVWTGQRTFGALEQARSIHAEIKDLQTYNAVLREENAKLTERIGYLRTDAFQEQEGKTKLNYRKAGEQLIVIKPQPKSEQVADSTPVNTGTDDIAVSDTPARNASTSAGQGADGPAFSINQAYIKKWWQHFFDKETHEAVDT